MVPNAKFKEILYIFCMFAVSHLSQHTNSWSRPWNSWHNTDMRERDYCREKIGHESSIYFHTLETKRQSKMLIQCMDRATHQQTKRINPLAMSCCFGYCWPNTFFPIGLWIGTLFMKLYSNFELWLSESVSGNLSICIVYIQDNARIHVALIKFH